VQLEEKTIKLQIWDTAGQVREKERDIDRYVIWRRLFFIELLKMFVIAVVVNIISNISSGASSFIDAGGVCVCVLTVELNCVWMFAWVQTVGRGGNWITSVIQSIGAGLSCFSYLHPYTYTIANNIIVVT
jgi:hypothetical protein